MKTTCKVTCVPYGYIISLVLDCLWCGCMCVAFVPEPTVIVDGAAFQGLCCVVDWHTMVGQSSIVSGLEECEKCLHCTLMLLFCAQEQQHFKAFSVCSALCFVCSVL